MLYPLHCRDLEKPAQNTLDLRTPEYFVYKIKKTLLSTQKLANCRRHPHTYAIHIQKLQKSTRDTTQHTKSSQHRKSAQHT